MFIICPGSNDPFFNLALEDYLLHHKKEDFVILYTNEPCVIVGKHQAVHVEVNTRFTEEQNIPVIRRISGGGTVYHDQGNLNFCFIKQSSAGKQIDFRLYTSPVIEFLSSLGVNAVFEGKNDLRVDGLKISGNAEHVFRERVLHHGTLLFDSDIENMRNSIKEKSFSYVSRAVESNRTSVTNLKPRLKDIVSTEELRNRMSEFFLLKNSTNELFNISETEESAVRDLVEKKYKTWDWNYGYGPPYTFNSWFESGGKAYRCRLMVKDGIIWECDFEGSDEMKAESKKLIGCRHMAEDLLIKFSSENIPIQKEEIYRFF